MTAVKKQINCQIEVVKKIKEPLLYTLSQVPQVIKQYDSSGKSQDPYRSLQHLMHLLITTLTSDIFCRT